MAVCCLFADGDNWKIKFGLYSADSVFTDNNVFAGVHPSAIDEWDIWDVQKYFPPTSEYAIMFFPHSNPTEPEYWPWPHDNDYTEDIRSPLDTTKTWRIKIRSLYSSSRTLTIWWTDIEDLPGDYLPIIITDANDTLNMREIFSYTAVFPPGVKRWKLTVVPNYYDRISVKPSSSIVRVSEVRHFRAYLHHEDDSVSVSTAIWSYRGSGGSISETGQFTGTSPGGGFIIADIGGIRDSAEVTVIPGGEFYSIPLLRGWNLVSLPAIPASNHIGDVLPGIIPPIYWWDSDSNEHRTADTLAAGLGYFVLSSDTAAPVFAGTAIDSICVPLCRGWNLVGGPSEAVHYPTDFETYPPGIIMIPPFIFKDNDYFLADSIAPSGGFWVLSATNGELKIITP
ncbi:MAG: hypothetical protein ACP5G4_00450 [bacterium]